MTPLPAPPPLKSILVTPPSPSITPGKAQQFIATGVYSNGTTEDLTASAAWTSSNLAVATINAAGLAAGAADGVTTIQAAQGGVTGSTDLMVETAALVSIAVFPSALMLLPGQTQQYGAIGTYADNSQLNLTALVTWASSDPATATITSSGFATAVAAGTADITATSGAIYGVGVLGVETIFIEEPPEPPDEIIELPPNAPLWPVFDVVEMAQEAAERAGIEFRAGYALRTARRSLELLSIEWANRGLNLWTIEGPDAIVLQPGIAEYALPDDTVDIIEHIVRTWWTNPPAPGTARWRTALGLRRDVRDSNPLYNFTDLPLDRMTLPEYAAIPNKYAPGRPTILNMRREIHPYFRVWMVPPSTPTYHLLFWRLRRMQPMGTGGTGQPEIPWRFIPAMIAGLAYYLALKSKEPIAMQKVPLLKAQYEEQFMLASDEDRDRAAFRFVPMDYRL